MTTTVGDSDIQESVQDFRLRARTWLAANLEKVSPARARETKAGTTAA